MAQHGVRLSEYGSRGRSSSPAEGPRLVKRSWCSIVARHLPRCHRAHEDHKLLRVPDRDACRTCRVSACQVGACACARACACAYASVHTTLSHHTRPTATCVSVFGRARRQIRIPIAVDQAVCRARVTCGGAATVIAGGWRPTISAGPGRVHIFITRTYVHVVRMMYVHTRTVTLCWSGSSLCVCYRYTRAYIDT